MGDAEAFLWGELFEHFHPTFSVVTWKRQEEMSGKFLSQESKELHFLLKLSREGLLRTHISVFKCPIMSPDFFSWSLEQYNWGETGEGDTNSSMWG